MCLLEYTIKFNICRLHIILWRSFFMIYSHIHQTMNAKCPIDEYHVPSLRSSDGCSRYTTIARNEQQSNANGAVSFFFSRALRQRLAKTVNSKTWSTNEFSISIKKENYMLTHIICHSFLNLRSLNGFIRQVMFMKYIQCM